MTYRIQQTTLARRLAHVIENTVSAGGFLVGTLRDESKYWLQRLAPKIWPRKFSPAPAQDPHGAVMDDPLSSW